MKTTLREIIRRKIRAFTFPFRHFHYKIKMCKRFWKHLCMSWECTDAIFYIPMEIFKDFYEYEFIKKESIVDWTADDAHKKAKQQMDEIYIYYMRVRDQILEQADECLNLMSKSERIEWVPKMVTLDGVEEQCYEMKTHLNSGFTKKQRDLNFENWKKYELMLYNNDKKYLVMLSELHDYLWT